MRRLGLGLVALLAATTLGLAAGTPAASGETHHPVRAIITFTKNHQHPFQSTLAWRAERHVGGTWRTIATDHWRAGSGFGGPESENACAKGRGWLPNGRYTAVEYNHYDASLIHGRVFYLGNHSCATGTLRTGLFIHSEQTAANRQCPNRPGDQNCRWEYPRINDYRSEGCIKMAPADIRSLVVDFHRFFRAGIRYPASRVLVRVMH